MVESLINKPRAQHPVGVKVMRIWHRRLREPLLTVLLAIQVISLFVLPPLRAAGLAIPHLAVIAVLLVFVSLAIVLSRSKVAIAVMLLSVVLIFVGAAWRAEQPDFASNALSTLGQVLAQMSLLWLVATAVFSRGRTTYHRILGAMVMYLAIGMIFTSLDLLLAQTVPDAFTHLPADRFALRETLTYFNFCTLTTGSFGDILPVHPIARSLANLESICGQLFPATLLARIVSLHVAATNE